MSSSVEVELMQHFHYSCGAPVDGLRFAHPSAENSSHQLSHENGKIQLINISDNPYSIDELPMELALNIVKRWMKHDIVQVYPHKVI